MARQPFDNIRTADRGGPLGSRFSVMQDRRQEAENEADRVSVVPRDEFVEQFAEQYTPSHLTMIGPTRRGKTRLCFQLLHAVLAKHRKDHWRVVVLHGKIKRRDNEIPEWAKKSNYRIVKSWPPGFTLRPSKMRHRVGGYVLRPLGNDKITAAEEEKILKTEFGKATRSNYHKTRHVTITLVDERAQADKDLRLTTDLDAPLQRGLPHNPEWNNIQRGKWCSYHCYDAPEHMFLFFDDDNSNTDRYAEFGVGDPATIKSILQNLKTGKSKDGGTISQCLYMRRSDRYMCIVDI